MEKTGAEEMEEEAERGAASISVEVARLELTATDSTR